jgi:uncharacterized protein with GYD domain
MLENGWEAGMTFFLFGKYSAESIKEADAERTEQAIKLIGGLGGKVKSMYALLGQHDLVFILEAKSLEVAMKISVELVAVTGISFTTYPAIPVNDFDRLLGELT